MCDLKLNLWADIFRNELVPWIHIRHFRRRARVHYEKLSLIFNGHIKYNFIIVCVDLQISSINFFSQTAHLWYDMGYPHGYRWVFLPLLLSLSSIHTFTQCSRRVLSAFAYSIIIMMIMAYAIQIHCVCGSMSAFAPIWPTYMCGCVSHSIRFDSIRFDSWFFLDYLLYILSLYYVLWYR